MTDLETTVQQLAARLQAVEDELAIIRLLTSYGFAVDGDDPDACAGLYSPDALVTIDDSVTLQGRQELRGIVTSEAHQAILPGCAHVMGPFSVHVSGDTATATGYATVYVAEGENRKIWRQSLGRWTLARTPDGWRVTRRESWARGREPGQRLARESVRKTLSN
jgi:uncharacterized protein (TIGR02246 family)